MLTSVEAPPTREELEAAQCWDPSDVVPRRPAMTEFRQRTRLHHARWRERARPPDRQSSRSAPRPGVDARLVGSRIPLPYARETGANVPDRRLRWTPPEADGARRAGAEHRPPGAVGGPPLVGGARVQPVRRPRGRSPARRPARSTPGCRTPRAGRPEVRFLHSPGRLDPEWLNSLRAFDAAFVLDRGRRDARDRRRRRELPRAAEARATRSPRTSGATARSTSDRRRSGPRRSTP